MPSFGETLRMVTEAIGERAFAENCDRWERNVREDRGAVLAALEKLKLRVAATRDNPVRNRDTWLEAVYRTHLGASRKAVVA